MKLHPTGLGLRLVTTVFLSIWMLQGCSLVFPIIAPFADLPAPTGPYTVSTRSFYWVDSSRDEFYTRERDFRRLALQVWYPSEDGGVPSAYLDHPDIRIPALAKQLRLPRSIIQHVADVTTNASAAGELRPSQAGYPVLLFSHGLSGMRVQNTALLEELASWGYVVIAADHSYDANITIFDDGSTADYRAGDRRVLKGSRLERLDLNQLAVRVQDLSFILDQLERGNSPDFLAELSLDLHRVGLLGHSLGGTTVITALAVDSRFQTALVLDGWYIPVPDSVLISGLDRPFLHLGQESWSDPLNYSRMDELFRQSSAARFKVLVPGTQHTDFTDMPLFSRFSYYAGYTGATEPQVLLNLIRQTSVHFFDTYLKGQDIQELLGFLDGLQGVQTYSFVPYK